MNYNSFSRELLEVFLVWEKLSPFGPKLWIEPYYCVVNDRCKNWMIISLPVTLLVHAIIQCCWVFLISVVDAYWECTGKDCLEYVGPKEFQPIPLLIDISFQTLVLPTVFVLGILITIICNISCDYVRYQNYFPRWFFDFCPYPVTNFGFFLFFFLIIFFLSVLANFSTAAEPLKLCSLN